MTHSKRREFLPEDMKDVYSLLNSLVIPRPIAWVSTQNADGISNLAPHSFFTIASTDPPMVLFVSLGVKDTLRNIRETADFVICGVHSNQLKLANLTSAPFPPEISEFDAIGLQSEPSSLVAPPRLANAPWVLECRLYDTYSFGNGITIVGEVVKIAIAEEMFEGGRVSSRRLDLAARLGGSEWALLGEIFNEHRPSLKDVDRSTESET